MLLLPDFYVFYGFCACPACVGSYLIDSGFRCMGLLAGGSPAATHFLLAKQKQSESPPGDSRPTHQEKNARYQIYSYLHPWILA